MRLNLSRPALLAASTLLAACAGQPAEPDPGPQPSAAPSTPLSVSEDVDSEAARSSRASTALAAGEFEDAHKLIEKILLDRYLTEAAELLDAEAANPQDGLLLVDKALAVNHRSIDAMLLRARGNAILGEQLIERGSNAVYIEGAFTESLDAYEQALARLVNDPAARFGASRSAFFLRRFEEALRHAQQGMQALEQAEVAPEISPLPARTLAEVAYRAYTFALTENNEDRATTLFGVTEQALDKLLGLQPNEPWAWNTLANLYLWADRIEEAKSSLKKGLDRVPDDGDLLARLVEVSKGNGGLSAALLDINAFVNKHPDIAGGYWWLGVQRFEVGLEKLTEQPPSTDDFEAAERAFARARDLDPELTSSCLGYEVNCRNGVGWAYYNADDLEAAEEAFLSMNELMPRGIEWLFEGRLYSGIDGLNFIGSRNNERGNWAGAAAIYETLRVLQPEEVQWANNAAFFHRDDAVELEQIGKDLCRRSFSPPTDPAEIEQLLGRAGLDETATENFSQALADRAELFLNRARATIERSYEAYLDVERLAPNDVRLVNDSALIRVWYLYRDLDRAVEMLERCIAMGAEQIQDPTLSEDDRDALENAWGDAYQNLGYLYLVDLKQPEKARPYFEKCIDLGDPRPIVTRTLIPMCDGDPEHPQLVEFRSWGRSCTEMTSDRETAR